MALLAFVVSLLTATLGGLGLVSPARLVDLARRFRTPAGLYAAVAVRLLFGAALFFVAPSAHATTVVRILGAVIFLAGLSLPIVGLARLRRLIDWWSAHSPAFIRAWAGVQLAFGLWLVYAVAPALSAG